MKNKKVLIGLFATGILLHVHPMGDNKDGMGDSAFAPLEEGQENIQGVVVDEHTKTELAQISFFGHTTVGGIRCEDNDSMTKFDLANIRSLKVISQSFSSKRFPDKEFALIRKTSLSDAAPQDMLVPRNIVLCGTEKSTGDQKSWKIFQINELKIHVQGEIPDIHSDSISKAPDQEQLRHVSHTQDHYKKMEVKVIEVKEPTKGVVEALRGLALAIVGVINSLFNAVKGLFGC